MCVCVGGGWEVGDLVMFYTANYDPCRNLIYGHHILGCSWGICLNPN